jgi:hypothetical protein
MKKEFIVKNGVSKVGGRFVAYFNGEKVISSKNEATAHLMYNRVAKKNSTVNFAPVTIEPENKFHINKRFEFLEKAVRMVATGVQSSVVVSGSGGLGKSHSVKKALTDCGLRDLSSALASSEEGSIVNRSRSFVFVKGFSTAKNLYRQLFENNDSIIVFDDCDSILKDPVAQNVLKAALDSYDTRIISWGAESRGDDDLPRSFIFTGRVIFITNMTMDRVDQAIRSRSITIDVSMTTQEMVDRMRVIAESDDFLPTIEPSVKIEALNFINRNKDKMKEISLRTLITVSKIVATNPEGYEEFAEYLTV